MFLGVQWLDDFLIYLTYERNFSQATLSAYQKDIRRFFDYLSYNNDQLHNLSPLVISNWLSSLSSAKMKPRSIARKLSCLRSFYKFLLKQNIVSENPFSLFSAPKATKNIPTTLSEDEILQIFDNMPVSTILDRRNKCMLIVLYTTGIRAAELCTLKCADIAPGFSQFKVMGKGKKERIIPLIAITQSYIKEWFVDRRILDKNLEDTLFLSSNGHRMTTSMIRKIVYKIFFNTSKHFYPHAFRYTFSSHLLNAQANLRHIQELLGHSSLSVTQRYTKMSIQGLKDNYHQFHPRG